ncbi:hypothetical protein DACRYDRAFT_103898 [Dacryopinax primogenitus]|uniref:Protein kinase domain-containing protein n=1 Tax=Dacryopinax primogenitus (strain DJM 731) TaxID=1858805 RepID=M5GEG6_DACPD|nr:uncharacterized protein DACRYDRAFT_103898 [Dacryopinax primogenitus]EJU05412.1 hypothetical protein DACRYDRAFT_103898 [Dacryopinax primogenitus]
MDALQAGHRHVPARRIAHHLDGYNRAVVDSRTREWEDLRYALARRSFRAVTVSSFEWIPEDAGLHRANARITSGAIAQTPSGIQILVSYEAVSRKRRTDSKEAFNMTATSRSKPTTYLLLLGSGGFTFRREILRSSEPVAFNGTYARFFRLDDEEHPHIRKVWRDEETISPEVLRELWHGSLTGTFVNGYLVTISDQSDRVYLTGVDDIEKSFTSGVEPDNLDVSLAAAPQRVKVFETPSEGIAWGVKETGVIRLYCSPTMSSSASPTNWALATIPDTEVVLDFTIPAQFDVLLYLSRDRTAKYTVIKKIKLPSRPAWPTAEFQQCAKADLIADPDCQQDVLRHANFIAVADKEATVLVGRIGGRLWIRLKYMHASHRRPTARVSVDWDLTHSYNEAAIVEAATKMIPPAEEDAEFAPLRPEEVLLGFDSGEDMVYMEEAWTAFPLGAAAAAHLGYGIRPTLQLLQGRADNEVSFFSFKCTSRERTRYFACSVNEAYWKDLHKRFDLMNNNKHRSDFQKPLYEHGSISTRQVGEFFGWKNEHPENLPNFDILSNPDMRFFVMNICLGPGPDPTAEVVDFLPRRAYQVVLVTDCTDGDLLESMAVAALVRYGDTIRNTLNALRIDGEEVTTSYDPNFGLPIFDEVGLEDETAIPTTIPRVSVTELAVTGAIDFRHYIIGRNQSLFRWIAFRPDVTLYGAEIRALAQLDSHPYVAPCKRIVLDPTGRKVVGYTSPYYLGGDLGGQTSFRSRNIAQLMITVDDLNFKYGLFHRDLHRRNVVLHNGDVKVIDFEFASKERFPIGQRTDGQSVGCMDAADADAACVIAIAYEMCTGKSARVFEDPDPELREVCNSAKLHSTRGDAVMDAQWIAGQSIDSSPDQVKAALAIWRRMRLSPQYTWAGYLTDIKNQLGDVLWLISDDTLQSKS